MAKKANRTGHSATKKESPNSKKILARSTESYGLMLVIGLLMCGYISKNFKSSLMIDIYDIEVAKFLGTLVLLGSGILIVLHTYCHMQFRDQYEQFNKWMNSTLGCLSLPGILYLAFIAAVAEEIFLRAALQVHTGYLFLSGCLALLHFRPNGVLPVFVFLSFATNVLLGLVYQYSGTVYAGMMINFILSAWILIPCARMNAKLTEPETNQKSVNLDSDERV